jgi:L-lactate dehydrogenase complex protein LldG
MQKIKSSEVILKRLRTANLHQIDNRFEDVDLEKDIYTPFDDDAEFVFAREVQNNGGKFVFCADEQELTANLLALAKERNWTSFFTKDKTIQSVLNKHQIAFSESEEDFIKTGHTLTSCEFFVARLGSVLISSKQQSGRRANFLPKTHIVIGHLEQIVPTVKDALMQLHNKYEGRFPSMTTLITGPSRTADIEKTLVMGMHGPQELIIFMLAEPLNK